MAGNGKAGQGRAGNGREWQGMATNYVFAEVVLDVEGLEGGREGGREGGMFLFV